MDKIKLIEKALEDLDFEIELLENQAKNIRQVLRMLDFNLSFTEETQDKE